MKYNSKLILETRLVVEMIWSSPDITIYIVVVKKNSIGTKERSGDFLQVHLYQPIMALPFGISDSDLELGLWLSEIKRWRVED